MLPEHSNCIYSTICRGRNVHHNALESWKIKTTLIAKLVELLGGTEASIIIINTNKQSADTVCVVNINSLLLIPKPTAALFSKELFNCPLGKRSSEQQLFCVPLSLSVNILVGKVSRCCVYSIPRGPWTGFVSWCEQWVCVCAHQSSELFFCRSYERLPEQRCSRAIITSQDARRGMDAMTHRVPLIMNINHVHA